jgi:DNA-directed RNA polymerase subunit RPC12/RpoP
VGKPAYWAQASPATTLLGRSRAMDIAYRCTNCSKEFKKPLSSLNTNGQFRCPFCGTLFKVKGPGLEARQKEIQVILKKSLSDLKGKFGRPK